ncbi:sugar phosphate isomerase/epimerase family protein [Acetobacter sp. LMG 32666]|uniref:sugar phosphate isomerase/epimerase family protein n=1 Tax=Acetobacter sp. LMG 32666 TaxID=2959295 RepID=UPI0030C8066A
MKLAISNIAWQPAQARDIYALMREYGFAGLEIAPGLAFPDEADPFAPSPAAASAFRNELDTFGLQPVSMQSLLFGVVRAQLFGTSAEQSQFEQAMLRAIGLAECLGIPNLVFGSPKNRAYPTCMSSTEAHAHAAEVFQRLGEHAVRAGTRIAIEPNPASYGTNFLTTVAETAEFVAALNHPGITLNYDLGALYANAETGDAGVIYQAARGHVSHVHLSEPSLAPAPASPEALASIARTLLQLGYRNWFSLEMRAPEGNLLHEIATRLALTAQVFSNLEDTCHAE